jgi:hypothetical protein
MKNIISKETKQTNKKKSKIKNKRKDKIERITREHKK